ncbi:hypothetical protein [Alkalicoccus daliensis]|uniref:Uncharacterized protein n=1 Tax=Alkalicoccus daliensis TaxID=745820 RepID=A0A1H0B6R4_9BACI|nr:hypothetical protein [Alkalicoccus daliensis]SDN41316.1 hypothetical protein SAMN04488053_101776 [Alkalicoccus daliensis]
MQNCNQGFVFIETMASLLIMGTIISAFVLISHTIHLESQHMNMEREANNLLFRQLQEHDTVSGKYTGQFGEYQGKTIYTQDSRMSCLTSQSDRNRKVEVCLPAYAS